MKILPLCAWGLGTALALALVVTAARSELGIQRAHAALVTMLSPPANPDQRLDQQLSAQMIAWSSGIEKQFRRQAEIIQALTDQRDVLATRVSAMERQLNDLTGSLSRTTARLEAETRLAQLSAAAATRGALVPKSDAPDIASPPLTAPATAPPTGGLRGPPTALQAQGAQGNPQVNAQANAQPTGQIFAASPALPPAPGFPASGSPASGSPAFTGAIPMPVSPPRDAATTPPPMTRPFPIHAPQVAAETAAARQSAARTPPSHTAPSLFPMNPLMTTGIIDAPPEPGVLASEFAIDLGGAPTIDALRARWNDLRNSQSPLLDNLKPLVALKENGRAGQELHLLAGPFNNTAATSRLCAVLAAAGVACQPSPYDGQRLAVR